MTSRKKYPKEFKLDAISLVLDQGYSRSEAARSLDINANMLCRWIKEHQSEDGQAFRGNGKLRQDQEEIRKLKAQVRRLEMEKDTLKKAAFFTMASSSASSASWCLRRAISTDCCCSVSAHFAQ
tara:strand:+ start:410 stop:781 length:372 start_codon:yes stop_codon:yes gene_type:complete